jgi:hypothetical protein
MTPQQHYRESVTSALAGYQLLEGLLKFYAEAYYNVVRAFLAGHLHFDYHRKDVEASALGRLINGFAKTCGNKKLVGELRELIGHRDQIAHQALLRLYDDDISEEKLHEMIQENHNIVQQLHRLQTEVLAEVRLIRQKLDLAHRE